MFLGIIEIVIGGILIFMGFSESVSYVTQQSIQYMQFIIAAVLIGCGGITCTISNGFSKLLDKEEKKTRDTLLETNKKEIESKNVSINKEYSLIIENGHTLAKLKNSEVENYFCPSCFKQINPSTDNCPYCNKNLKV